jgi:hypothetical protein
MRRRPGSTNGRAKATNAIRLMVSGAWNVGSIDIICALSGSPPHIRHICVVYPAISGARSNGWPLSCDAKMICKT